MRVWDGWMLSTEQKLKLSDLRWDFKPRDEPLYVLERAEGYSQNRKVRVQVDIAVKDLRRNSQYFVHSVPTINTFKSGVTQIFQDQCRHQRHTVNTICTIWTLCIMTPNTSQIRHLTLDDTETTEPEIKSSWVTWDEIQPTFHPGFSPLSDKLQTRSPKITVMSVREGPFFRKIKIIPKIGIQTIKYLIYFIPTSAVQWVTFYISDHRWYLLISLKSTINNRNHSFLTRSSISLACQVLNPSLSNRLSTFLSWLLLVMRLVSTTSLERLLRLDMVPDCRERRESSLIILILGPVKVASKSNMSNRL